MGWPLTLRGPLPEGQGRETSAVPVARSTRGAAAAAARHRGRSPSPPPAPASCLRRRAPARPGRLAQQRSHSLRGRLQGYPRGGGWGRLRHWPPPLLSLRPRPSAAPGRPGSKPQSRRRDSKVRGGKSSWEQTSVRAGGGLSWLWVPGESGQARSRREGAAAPPAGRALSRVAWAGGSGQEPEAPLARWGAETSGRPNLLRKLTK